MANRRVAVFAACALAGVGTLSTGAPASAARPGTGLIYRLPAGAPTPGPGYRIQSAYRVLFGVQVYTCVAGTDATGTGAWSTPASTPRALLHEYGGPRAIYHHAGPRWTSLTDGSTIVGTVAQRVSQDGTIPWLLLTVTAHERSEPGRVLDAVTHVSRVNTTGGVGPAGACTPGEADRQVPYGADYVFWVPTT